VNQDHARERRPSRQELADEIAREERRLAEFIEEARDARTRLEALHAGLTASEAPEAARAATPAAKVVDQTHSSRTSAQKVALFRTLFRGREDVFPIRFLSKRTGKAGYAPACRNKFVRGVCELPKIKCGECPNQAFVPADDAAVLGHLTGRHVMGVYPLLPDETCWFLAIDFDKKAWLDDVRAFIETCRSVDVAPVVERSRSGNGAHVWFFFNEPIPAVLARQMGSALITETMSRRHELSMDSYDRLFPSQDTMPKGGFGNLIALPLQQAPRKIGNAIFLNPFHPQLAPLPDDQQWNHLASAHRLERPMIERIVDDVISALEEGRSPLLLTERRDHLEFFAARLKHFARHLVVLHGGAGAKERRLARERLQAIPPNEERLVIATGRYIGEGFDDARLDTLFLALPVSWKGTLVQYSGRLHRLNPGKTDVRVVDYVDREVPMLLRMFQRRMRGYQASAMPQARNGPPSEQTRRR